MLNFSPILLLIPFGVYLFIHFSLTLINIRHIFKIGAVSLTSFIFTFIFLFYSFAVISITWNLVSDFPWNQPFSFELGGIINASSSFDNGQ